MTKPEIYYSARQLSLGWAAYRTVWDEQARLRHASYGEKELITTLAHLPKLKHLTLSNFHDPCRESDYSEAKYKETLMKPRGDAGYGQHCGLPQFFSLVRALHNAGMAIERLTAGLISWRVLKAKPEDFELMMSVFEGLKSLQMWFIINQEYEWRDPDEELLSDGGGEDDLCQEVLDRGRHLELLRLMPKLRAVDLCFSSFNSRFDVESMFKDIQWPFLRKISLKYLRGTDRDLLGVLQRHAGTLKILKLSYYRLAEGLRL